MNYLSVEKEDGIVILTLDHPGEKVNKLNEQLIEEFKAFFDEVKGDDSVHGIVLASGKEDNFIAGADVEMLKDKQAPDEITELSRTGNRMLLEVENFEKPVVAAIHGACVGGGQEVVMACHYRVASKRNSVTHLGQPEVKLGLLPGGGGTQRFPRLVGIQNALKYMLTGKNIYPKQAYRMGLVDELVHKDAVVTAAKKAVERINAGKFKRKDRRGLGTKLLEGNFIGRKIIFSQARKRAQSNTKGNYPAPFKIIDCVEHGMKKGKKAGLEKESVEFGKMAASPEAKNLMRLFFAMQGAKKNPAEEKVRKVEKIGVLGAGLMGSGIAEVSSDHGYRVLLKDQDIEQASKGEQKLWESLNKKAKKGIITDFERDRQISLVSPTGSYKGFENADMVIEAVFEDLDLKKQMVRDVEQRTPDHCIFASNTSSLPISEIAKASKRPEQVVGMHYFSPVPKMPLLEIIKTDRTAEWVIATARDVGIKQGKHVIVVHDGPGFYTTRILAPYMNEALMLLEEGAPIDQIDREMKNFGFPVGPLALFDEVGIDVAAHITDTLNEMFGDRGVEPNNKPKELFEAGYKGKKNKKGFYNYEQSGSKTKKKDPNTGIYQYFGGPDRSKINAETIHQRLSLVMVNEAAWCLQDDILENPTDGDLGAILGLGFPPFLGGPFRYIDQTGAGEIVQRLEKYRNELGQRFTPAEILTEAVKHGDRFHSEQ